MNRRTNKLDMEVFLVGSGDQALGADATPLFTTGTSLNIADQQLAVLCANQTDATYNYNDMIAAATTSSEIRLTQGTPASVNTRLADDLWKAGHRSHVPSEIMKRDKVRSVTTTLPSPGFLAMELVTPGAINSETLYGGHIKVKSVKGDINFGYNDNVSYRSFETPDFTIITPADNTHYTLTKLLSRYNSTSNLVIGTADFAFIGVSLAGGAGGVAIGGITPTTNIPFQVHKGITYEYTSNLAFVNTLNDVIAGTSGLTAASEFVLIDDATALTDASIDAFLVVGLDQSIANAYDDIEQARTNVQYQFAEGFLENGTVSTKVSNPTEATGSSRKLQIDYMERARMNIHTHQIRPDGEFFIEPKLYIQDSTWYTETRIDFFDDYEWITIGQNHNKQTTILLPASVTAVDVNGGVIAITSAATTVADLNTVLAGWFTNVEYHGAATAAAPFV